MSALGVRLRKLEVYARDLPPFEVELDLDPAYLVAAFRRKYFAGEVISSEDQAALEEWAAAGHAGRLDARWMDLLTREEVETLAGWWRDATDGARR